MNDTLATIVVGIASLVSFVCFISVLIQMFQRGAKGMGIPLATIVVGIASLVSFVCFISVLIQMFQRGAKGMGIPLATIVVGIASLVSFVCFILVLIQMFQRGAKGMGILCIVLSLCCGVGMLVTFIYGWVKAREWNMSNLMTVWTVAVAVNVVTGTLNPEPFVALRERLQIQVPER